MARNAQSVTPNLPFQSNPNSRPADKAILVENLKDPAPFRPSSYQSHGNADFGPPPAYTDLQDPRAPVDWNTPFTPQPQQNRPYSPSSSVTAGTVNPVPSNPYNPFQ